LPLVLQAIADLPGRT